MGNIETRAKFSRLKSFFSTEDDYLEAATEVVLSKKLFLKILQNSEENNCAGVSFSPAGLLERFSNTVLFLYILQIF